ncbi:sugar dehydrogenase complex small subunit [Erwinia sp. B116]|uniref:sugar dehydrogenase complex small subunit n=1 Tax=Erwinia sp. B116 TaxID=1561024 RepID=UPI000C79554F|nr:sugar dehydrogenase complex small subunit [Erwinia sp. B116]PLV63805.1 sorbitol dehydrogenase [Erwinia sp. B116]
MAQKNNSGAGLSRRRLLQGMAVLSLSAACSALFPAEMARAAASVVPVQRFSEVSAFLVSRPVGAILSRRYLEALTRHYPDFPAQLDALATALGQRSDTHVDAFLQDTAAGTPLHDTATLIVSAWYTGVVGEGAKTELIAYADAMMYLPTQGILAVPTYGGGPDSWGEKPGVSTAQQGATA